MTPQETKQLFDAILSECSRRPHYRDGRKAVEIIQNIEAIVVKARDAKPLPYDPNRDGVDAHDCLDSIYGGP